MALSYCRRMASATVLSTLKARADQADFIIAELRNQISALQTAAGKREEEALRAQNDALRREIEKVKTDLIVAEIRNGVRQVPLPQRRNLTTGPSETSESSKKTASEPEEKKAIKEPETVKDGKKAAQGKKEDGKGKGKKAAASVESAEENGGEKMDVSRLDFRIGKIVDVQKHPDADTLYVETVDIGEPQTLTVVSGLVKHVPIDQMRERLAVFLCNLKASKMRGITSEGMIMCASAEKVEILEPPPGVVPGDKITFDGYPGTPDKLLNPKKKIWETLKPDVRTNSERVATYKGVPFKVEGKGIVKAPTMADAQIS